MTTSDRALAEQALASLDTGNTSGCRWPPVAERIRQARERLGLTITEVAKLVGITSSSYYDAEGRDDEVFTVLSLAQIVRLGRLLSVAPGELLFGPSGPERQEISFAEIVERLGEKLEASGLSAEEFGEKIGWDVSNVLSRSDALWEFNLVGLRDVCNAIDVDWVTALPGQDSIPPGD